MWKKYFQRSAKKHSNRVMDYRVCQLILCHNNILIGDWQSLQIKSLGQAENSIVSNVCKKNFIKVLIKQLTNQLINFRLRKYGTRDSCWSCLQHSLCYDWNTIYSVCDRWCWADFCHTCFISLGQNQANSDANHGICQVSFVTLFCPIMSLYFINSNDRFFLSCPASLDNNIEFKLN